MIYYTISLQIKKKRTSSQILEEMREGATRWGKCIDKTPTTRDKIEKHGINYYMKVGYK
jgi:hypothetical protein